MHPDYVSALELCLPAGIVDAVGFIALSIYLTQRLVFSSLIGLVRVIVLITERGIIHTMEA